MLSQLIISALCTGSSSQHDPLWLQTWGITHLYFEKDTEPYANERDGQVREAASKAHIEVETPVSHTLYVSHFCHIPFTCEHPKLGSQPAGLAFMHGPTVVLHSFHGPFPGDNIQAPFACSRVVFSLRSVDCLCKSIQVLTNNRNLSQFVIL